MEKIIVGIDEAGRGPLAGPVIAAAVTVLGNLKSQDRNYKKFPKLKDSKLLSPRQRDILYTELYKNPDVCWGIGKVGEKTIDKINIFQATSLAMKRAVLSLERKLRKRIGDSNVNLSHDREKSEQTPVIDCLFVDGNMLVDLPIRQKAIVRADTFIPQCMAASIAAKVARDRIMLRLHKKYPQYGFDRHKGYGTEFHLQALKQFGPCDAHRRSFSPMKFEARSAKSETSANAFSRYCNTRPFCYSGAYGRSQTAQIKVEAGAEENARLLEKPARGCL